MKKPVFYWIIAIVITLSAAVYQRMTGPTYPKRFNIEYNGSEYKVKLPRSHVSTSVCPVELKIPAENLNAKLKYKRYPSNDEWTAIVFESIDNKLIAEIPNQEAAGKILYQVSIFDGNDEY